MIKKILSVATLATLTVTSLHAVDAGNAHVDPIDASTQFFPNGVREFSYTSNSAAHQQNAVLVADGKIYIVYYDQDGSLILARRSATDKTDTWIKREFSPSHDQTDPDSHRTANIALSPNDGRLHILWGHHADKLRYVVTQDPNATQTTDAEFQASLFEPERQFLAPGENLARVCYPRLWVGADDKLQVAWRDDGGSGNADSFISTYNDDKTWTPRLRIVNGKVGAYTDPDSNNNGGTINDNRNAYFNDFSYRNGKTHASWTYRENSQAENGLVTNHDLHYAYSSNGGSTWYNRLDNQVVGAISLNTPDIKFKDVPYAKRVDNQTGQTIDKDGGVHMLFRHFNDADQKRMFHYYKAEGSTDIIENELAISSSIRPKIYADPTDDEKNTLYIVTIVGSSLRVYGANQGADNWGTWETLYNSASTSYLTATAQISADGKTLYILAQRRPSSVDRPTNSSSLELITLPVSPDEILDPEIQPEVEITSPTDDLILDVGYDLSVEATASDANGTVANVALYIDGVLAREITTAPYIWGQAGTPNEFELTGLDAGTYDVEIIATDNDGLTAAKAFSLTVNANPLPAGATAYTISDATITASTEKTTSPTRLAQDANDDSDTTRWNSDGNGTGQWLELDFGTVRTLRSVRIKEAFDRIDEYLIEYWDGAAWQRAASGRDFSDDQTIPLPNIATSKLRLTAVSLKGGSTSSISIFTFSATAIAYAPDIELVFPTGDTTIDQGEAFSVVANIGDLDGDLINAALSIDGVLVRDIAGSPFIWGEPGTPNADELGGLAPGSYQFEIKATDARGLTSTASFTLAVKTPLPEGSEEYLVTDATITASSEKADRPAQDANDGDDLTRWNSNTPGPGQWLELDFGGEKTISSVRIKEAFSRIGVYLIEYWDGSSWQTAATGDGLSEDQTVALPNIKTSKIRFTVVDLKDGTGSSVSIFTFSATALTEAGPQEKVEATLSASEDTFIKGGTNGDTNYEGSNSRLEVRNNGNDNNDLIAYTKFDLTSLATDAVDEALVRFSGYVAGSDVSVPTTIKVFGIPDDSWSAATLTWNTAPYKASKASDLSASDIVELGTLVLDITSETYTIDATDFINANIGDGLASIILVGETSSSKPIFISDSESGGGLSLDVSYSKDQAPAVDFAAIEDSYIRGGANSGNNYGTEGAMSVRNNGNVSNDMVAYVKFDLSSIQGAEINKATLKLPGRNASSENTPRTVQVWGIPTDSWSESAITWDNAPNNAGDGTVAPSEGAAELGKMTFSLKSQAVVEEIDVTAFVATYGLDGNVTFMIVGDEIAGDVIRINSSENAEPPVLSIVHGEAPVKVERPFIWTRDSERDSILAKIDNNPWAATVFQGMKDRIADDLVAYEADKDAFLRELPISWDDADPIASTQEAIVRGPFREKLNVALDAAILYHLTQDERYAHLGADIMQNAIEGFTGLEPNPAVGNGGWLLRDDHLKEAREISIQLPIAYDYLYDWLFDGNFVYDVKAAKSVPFAWEDAQFVFTTFADLTLEHGTRDNNWSVLMTPSLLHNGLAIDDPEKRASIVASHTGDGTPRQGPVGLFAAAYQKDGDTWPESFQYSNAVANWSVYAMTLLDRYDPDLALYETYPQLPKAISRIQDFAYPNEELISFGDGPRELDAPPYQDYEMTYQQALRNGNLELASKVGSLIQEGIEDGKYDRSELMDYRTLSPHHAPLQLLWFADEVVADAAETVLPRSDVLPFAGIALQRNEAPDGDPTKGLMYQSGGGSFVHSHAGGLNMELYGVGQVLGVDAGHENYSRPIHSEYYRVWAAHNTIVVNGSSRGEGGWSDISHNPVELVAMEPMAQQPALSPEISFTSQSFVDDRGDGAEATQLRTMALIRTGPDSGFYFDMFRSDSALDNEYHDYLYHNIGDYVSVSDSEGNALPLAPTPERYQSDVGDKYKQPGWRYFENAQTSSPFDGGVTARWALDRVPAGPTVMEMHMTGQGGREYSTVDAPRTIPAPAGYRSIATPTLVVRQQGEAWRRPFSAVFEPRLASNAPVVQSIEQIEDDGTVVGMRVQTEVGGAKATYHIFALPDYGSYSDILTGISFEGRFGIIIEKANGEVTFYLGDATAMGLGRNEVRSSSGEPTSANVVVRPGQEPVVSSKTPVEVTRVDSSQAATGQLVFAADYTLDSNHGRSKRVKVEDDIVSVQGANTWIAFPDFNFGNGVSEFHVVAANKANWSSPIELRKFAPDGPLIGKVEITPTGDNSEIEAIEANIKQLLKDRNWWGFVRELRALAQAQIKALQAPPVFEAFSTDALDRVSGINDLYLVFPRGGLEISRFYFEAGAGGIASIELTAVADGITRGAGNSDSVDATGVRLAVKDTGDVGFDRVSYVKFDLDEIPATHVLSADLFLRGSMREQSGSIDVNVYAITDDSWTEENLSWSYISDPNLTDAAIVDPDAIFEGSMNFKLGEFTVESLDVSGSVNANLLDGKLSLALLDENDTNAQTFIDSREQSDGVPPTLYVLYEYIPSEIGTLINAAAYDEESHPADRYKILPFGDYLAFARNGTWVKFSGFNFDTGASTVSLQASSPYGGKIEVEFRLGSPDGELLATIEVAPQGRNRNAFNTYASELLLTPTGQQDLYLVFKSSDSRPISVENFQFE